jgi:hypothetical protein
MGVILTYERSLTGGSTVSGERATVPRADADKNPNEEPQDER